MMRRDEVNRDPGRAKKRAVADARCALRKLGLWDELERISKLEVGPQLNLRSTAYVLQLTMALGLVEEDE